MYNEKTIEKLKQKILDLAIRGKLVPQDPNDEPASVLIEKIRKEREKLIKEGKIKKPKEDSFIFKGSDNLYYENVNGKVKCIQDEIPFEIPESWVWCRLGNICEINLGFTYKPKYFSEGIPFLSVSNLKDNEIDYKNCNYISLEEYKKASYGSKPLKGDILFGRVGSIGRPQIVNVNFPFCIFVSLGFLRLFSFPIFNKYVLLYINSNLFKNLVKRIAKGTGRINLNTGWLKTFLFPLPPINEQNNIVNKYAAIHESIQLVENTIVDKNKKKQILKFKVLNTVFSSNSSYKSYYENRISTNLEEYIGKNDIGDGDWVLSENMDEKGNIKLIQLKHIGSGKYIDKPYCKINNSFFTQNKCSEIKKDYLLINRLISDKMNVCIMPDIQSKCITSVDMCWIKPNNKYLTKYLMYYLMSPCIQKEVLNLCSGSTRKRISKKNLIKIPMLIHNLNVQKEIVKEIDKIFSLIDRM